MGVRLPLPVLAGLWGMGLLGVVTRFAPGTTGGFDARILHSHVRDTRPRSSMDQSARLRTWWLGVRILPRALSKGMHWECGDPKWL